MSLAAAWGVYRAAGRLASPLARPHLRRRAAKGKEDPERAAEKRGIPSASLNERPVWLHAVSVGESVAALPVAHRLQTAGFKVLFTTGTPAAAARIASEAPFVVHQYAPLDTPPFLARFLDHWRPRAALFTEAEIWPTTLHMLSRRQIPRAHVNARLSERSFARWTHTGLLARHLFSLIPLALTQTGEDAARFAALGVGEARATGNLKFDAPAPTAPREAVDTLRAAIAGRPVWLAASIHPGEEGAIVQAHRTLQAQRPALVTIVAPRHVATADLVADAARRSGLDITRRSASARPEGLYLADTLGEMGVLYAAAPIVFLGGSLVPLSGHNPAEPAAFGGALLTGPSHGNMFGPFLAGGGARIVTDGACLADAVAGLLDAPHITATMGEAARAILDRERGAADRTMAALQPVLSAARGLP